MARCVPLSLKTPMQKFLSTLALCLGAVLAPAAYADHFSVGPLTVIDPHARATVVGMKTSGAWFGVKNDGSEADRIVSARAELAGTTELHNMKMDGDIMRMFQIDGIEIPAGQTVTLGQGNKLHVMLLELKQPLVVGERFPLTIQFEKAGSVTVDVVVQEINSGGHGHHKHKSGEAHKHPH